MAATLLLASACGSTGGDDGPGEPQPAQLLSISSEPRIDLPGRVSLLVQVLDSQGLPVPGLEATDFRLFENDREISPTEAQQQLLPRPKVYQLLSVLLLDLSSSISSDPASLAAEIAAAKGYVDIVTRDPAQRIAISFFFGVDRTEPATIFDPVSERFEPLGFTADAALLKEALDNVDRIEVVDDSTNLYGAVIEASAQLADEARALLEEGEVEFVSQALVTFTDGSHNANDLTLAAAKAALESAAATGAAAFTIGVGSEADRNALRALGPSGFVDALSLASLSASFEQVGARLADQANSYYRIGYISPKNDGSASPLLRVEAARSRNVALLETSFSTRFFSAGAGFVTPASRGVVEIPEGRCEAVEVDESDRSWVMISDPQESGLRIGRYLADGSPDPDFGNRGVAQPTAAQTGIGSWLEPAAMTLSDDGGAVVVARRRSLTTFAANLAIVTVSASGELVVSDLPASLSGDPTQRDRANALIADGSGRVWIGGASTGVAGGSRRLLVRLVRGTGGAFGLDASFGVDGVVTHLSDPLAAVDSIDVLVEDGARVLAIGMGYNAARGAADLQIVAFDESGALDTDYGNAGIVDNWAIFPGSSFDGLADGFAAILDPMDRHLVVAGSVQLGGVALQPLERAALWRIDSDGLPDPGFVGGLSNPFGPGGSHPAPGIVTLGTPLVGNPQILFGRGSWLRTVTIAQGGPGDGDLLAGGARLNAASHSDAIWLRLGPAGLLRSQFNGTGFLIEDGSLFDDGDESLADLALRRDGSNVACGASSDSGSLAEQPLLYFDDDPRRLF